MYFFEDIEFDMARYQLATERNCDVTEIPYEDAKARIYRIDEFAEY